MAQKKPHVKSKNKKQPSWLILLVVAVSVVGFYFQQDISNEFIAMPAAVSDKQPGHYTLTGVVTHVADGDTINLRVDGQRQRIRLASIDAPETEGQTDQPGQTYAEQAQQQLANLVLQKNITVSCYEQDHYNRHVCDVPYQAGKTANYWLVENGWAWANTSAKERYLRDPQLKQAQAQARAAQIGVWQDQNPTPPWIWRKQCWQQQKCD